MKMTDTHIHLYLPEFDADREMLMEQAAWSGVEKFYHPNIDSDSIDPLLKLSQSFTKKCFPMMGLHPCSVKQGFEVELKTAEEYFSKESFFAVGEIGLDLYWDKTFFEQQKEAFRIQCGWAVEKNLPVAIHTRNSFDETISLIEQMADKPRGIFHCFSGNAEQAKKAIDLGFFLGIGGVVTFKNSGMDKTIEQIDLKHLVLETDAPYLAPVPHRGKRNEPAFIKLVAGKIALIKNISADTVAEVTSANAKQIFEK